MYLHLGKNVVVPTDSIIGIFDLDNSSQSHITREFLKRAQQSDAVESVSDDLPKSFVLCQQEQEQQRLYLSQLAAQTLLKRRPVSEDQDFLDRLISDTP